MRKIMTIDNDKCNPHRAGMRDAKPDAIDLKILAVLQNEGRLTKAALAQRVGLSPTPCWERLRRLEKAGYIRGYRANIALEKLAPLTTVLVEVTLKEHRYQDFELFERHVRQIDEVVECHATGGGIDYLLKIMVRDVDAYQCLIDDLLVADVGIGRYFTYIVTRAIKDLPQAPVNLAIDALGEASARRPGKSSASGR
jgi:Lrp/AsnC family transcriptional regulator of ectoine degradation